MAERPKDDIDDVSRGSNPTIYTFCTLILICLLLTSVTWHPKLKKPVTLAFIVIRNYMAIILS